jgi:threonine/homoserine/homoserine lactone efflux protein
MNATNFAAFWGVSFLFVITPGVDWAYAISAGLRGRVVVPAVTGLLLGHLLATVIVAVGVGAFVASRPMILGGLTVTGALYLFWLGINMLFHPSQPRSGEMHETDSWAQWAAKGAGISGLNPKVFLLFLALLPQFTDPAASWSVPAQIVALGLVHVASCGVVYLLVGFSSQRLLQSRPHAALIVSRLSGAAMTVIAAILLAEQVFHLTPTPS